MLLEYTLIGIAIVVVIYFVARMIFVRNEPSQIYTNDTEEATITSDFEEEPESDYLTAEDGNVVRDPYTGEPLPSGEIVSPATEVTGVLDVKDSQTVVTEPFASHNEPKV